MVDVPCLVGIDVAKAQLDIAWRPTGERWEVPNDPHGCVTLVKRLQAVHPTLMVLEATGGLERTVTAALGTDMLHPLVEATKVEGGGTSTGGKSLGPCRPLPPTWRSPAVSRTRRGAFVAPAPSCAGGVRAWTSRITGTRSVCGRRGATILCSTTALSRRRPSGMTARGGHGRSRPCQARWPSTWGWWGPFWGWRKPRGSGTGDDEQGPFQQGGASCGDWGYRGVRSFRLHCAVD